MLRRFHERFGTAGVVVAVIALVAALGGTAIAAGGLNGPTKKLIKKEAKKWGKKFAKTGPAGPAGPAGANGKDGAQGPEGKQGAQGEPGTPGKDGVACPGGECQLESGATLKGEWSLSGAAVSGFELFVDSVSFALPLEAPPVKHYIRASGEEAVWNETTEEAEEVPPGPECPGSAAEPEAAPGNLCVYAAWEENTRKEFVFGVGTVYAFLPNTCSLDSVSCFADAFIPGHTVVSRFGFGILTLPEEEGPLANNGTWAVTAE